MENVPNVSTGVFPEKKEYIFIVTVDDISHFCPANVNENIFIYIFENEILTYILTIEKISKHTFSHKRS